MSTAIEPAHPAARVDAAVRAVDGVRQLFAAEPAVVHSARRMLTGDVAADAPLSVVAGAAEHVTVSVAVAADRSAADVGADVAAAVRSAVDGVPEVTVRISRIVS